MDPHNSGTKPKLTREATGKKETTQGKHTSINMAYDAQASMMHVRFKYAWHGKCTNKYYKLSGDQYATGCILTKHHINYLIDSRY